MNILNWKLIFFMGILYIMLSFIFIWSPIASTINMNLFIGWCLIFFGGINVFYLIKDKVFNFSFFLSILYMILGVYFLYEPMLASMTAVSLIAFVILIIGFNKLFSGFEYHKYRGSNWLIVSGIVNVLVSIALLILSNNIILSVFILASFISIAFLVEGIGSIIFSWKLKQLEQEDRTYV